MQGGSQTPEADLERRIDALKWIAGTSDSAQVKCQALKQVFELRRQQLEEAR